MSKILRGLLSLVLLGSLLTVIEVSPAAAAGLSACSDGAGVTSNLTVAASHGQAFYIDSGNSPKLDAGYVGYKVTNAAGATKKGLWVSLTNFTGGKVTLANIDDQYMPLDDITSTGTKVVYFMLKASGASASAQSHVVSIYDRRPDLAGAVLQRSCTYTFSAVKETIKASANKVADNAAAVGGPITVSNTSPALGEEITIKVEGGTGNIGAGGTPDLASIWLTPAAVSSWPTGALRLKKVSIIFDGNDNGWSSTPTYTDQLLITNANGLAEVDQGYYIATYTFQVIGKPAAAVTAVPVAQIASGTQMKHSDTTGAGSTATINFSGITIPETLAKTVTSSTGLETGTVSTIAGASPGTTYVAVPYKLELSTTGVAATVDELVDTPAVGAIFYAGSAVLTDTTRTSASIPDAMKVTSESTLSPRPLHFVGPFSVTSTRSIIITYKMWLPANGGTYLNNAYALVGTQKIGASSSAIPNVSVVTGNGSGSITPTTGTTTLSVVATTDPASSVASTSAVMNATVDPNGITSTIKFQYGISPSLSTINGTVTATTNGTSSSADPVSSAYSLSGLTQGTTYYYRVVVYSGTGAVLAQGDITSFTTIVVASPPSPTTIDATNISASGTTLNGNISPNNTLVTKIAFQYSTVSNLGSSVTLLTLQDTSVSPAVDIQTSGVDVQSFSAVTGTLSAGQTYYFRIVICTGDTSTGSGICGNSGTAYYGSILSFNLAKTSQTITFEAMPNKTFGDASFTNTAIANPSHLQVALASLTTSVCTVTTSFNATTFYTTVTITILSVGDCTLEATQSGNGTYNAASPVSQTFNIAPKLLTITAADKSKTFGGSDPTFTASVTGFVSPNAGTVSSAVYTFSGKSGYSYAPSTTVPTATGIYAIDPSLAILTFTNGDPANYVTEYIAGTYTINAATKLDQTIVMDNYSGLLNGSTLDLDTLISNGGSGNGAITYVVNSGTCTISGSILTATSGTGTCEVTATKAADSTYNAASDPATITLAAPYTVTFSANGASGSASSTSVSQTTVGGSITLATVGSLSLTGSSFMGWSTAASGGTLLAGGSAYTPSSSLTLYAQWITTSAANPVSNTTATLNGSASQALTTPKLCYSSTNPSGNFNGSTCSQAASGTYTGYTANITGLSPSTTYYFQQIGTVNGTIFYGSVLTFTTLATYTVSYNLNGGATTAPTSQTTAAGGSITLNNGSGLTKSNSNFIGWGTAASGGSVLNNSYTPSGSIELFAQWITTTAASSVASTSATVNGSSSTTLSTPRFCYSTTDPGSSFNASTCTSTSATGSYTANLTGLTPGSTYYFQIYGTVNGTIYYGGVLTFTTPAGVPTVTTVAASSVDTTSATINGTINANAALTTDEFCWGTATDLTGCATVTATPSTATGTNSTSISYGLTGLTASTTYYFKAMGTNSAGGPISGSILSFTTNSLSASAPTPVTVAASSVEETTATLNGTMSAGGASTTVTFEYCDSTVSGCTSSAMPGSPSTASAGSVTGSSVTNVSSNITGLTAGHTYYFRVKGVNSASPSGVYGNILSITTKQPQVITYTTSVPSPAYPGGTYTPAANGGGSGNPVTFTVSGPCSISGGVITFTGAGSCVVTANQSGNSSYTAAAPVTQTITVTLQPWSITATNANYTIGGTVPTLTGTPSPSGGLSGSLTCRAYTSADTGYATALTIDANLAAGTYVIRCTGTTASGYATPTITNATLTVSASTPTTYTITASAGTGGSISPNGATTVTSGNSQSFTITITSGYSINTLTVDGSTVSTVTTYTFTNVTADHSISVTFTANSSPGPSNNNSGGNGKGAIKIVVQKVTVKSNTGSSGTTTTTSSSPTGGTSTTTTSTTNGTTTSSTTTVAPNGTTTTSTTTGITNSNASSTGQTNVNGGVISALTNSVESVDKAVNKAAVLPVDTTASTELVIDPSVPASVAVNRGQDNKLAVQAINGWTGRVLVSVVNAADETQVESYLEVVINPLPVTTVVVTTPPTENKPIIKWDPSPSQNTGYTVLVNGKVACQSATPDCGLSTIVGPKSKIEVITNGNDNTSSVTRVAGITPTKPIPALTVYFNVASSALTKTEIKKLDQFVKEMKAAGLTRVLLEGHTDVQGSTTGYDNQTLSNNRAKQTAAYLRKFLKVKFTQDQFAETKPAVIGDDETAYKNNRRTEVKVW